MSISESEPLENFLYAIRSSVTKDRYKRRLADFFKFMEIKGDLESQARHFVIQAREKERQWVFANVMKFLSFHKERAERGEISNVTVRNYYKPLKLFLEMNDLELSWKRIGRGLPRGRRYAADRAPTIQEIQKLVEYPDRRIRAIVFTMCASGIRLGAWDYLRWGDIAPIKKDDKIIAAKIVVYAGDEEQYNSFISPEAYSELQKWVSLREESGERITKDSWLMRDLWNADKYSRGLVSVPKKLQSLGIKRLVERALYAQKIRSKLPEGQRRHEFQADHGFRKFFKTRAEQCMRPINVEMLMGHSTGVSDSYYRPNENELLSDYLNAVPVITIQPENLQKLDLAKQEERISALESERTKVEHLEKGVNIIGALLAEQKVKNGIWNELEHPTHHHTERQIEQLKQFCSSPPLEESWKEFMDWAKSGPKVYRNNSDSDDKAV